MKPNEIRKEKRRRQDIKAQAVDSSGSSTFIILLLIAFMLIALLGRSQAVKPSFGFGVGYLTKTENVALQIKADARLWDRGVVAGSFAFNQPVPMQLDLTGGYLFGKGFFQVIPSVGYAWYRHGQQKQSRNYGQVIGGIELLTQFNNGIIYAEWRGSYFGIGIRNAFYTKEDD